MSIQKYLYVKETKQTSRYCTLNRHRQFGGTLHETCQIADEEEETEEIRLLRLKGRAIESMYYQDQLDLSPIEETVLLLLLQNKGYWNGMRIEQLNNPFLPYIRTLVGKDFLQLRQIITLTKNRNDKKIEILIDTFVDYLLKAYLYKFHSKMECMLEYKYLLV